jgi:hypothetical protein
LLWELKISQINISSFRYKYNFSLSLNTKHNKYLIAYIFRQSLWFSKRVE